MAQGTGMMILSLKVLLRVSDIAHRQGYEVDGAGSHNTGVVIANLRG